MRRRRSGASMTAPQGSAPQSANVAVLVSDASSEDWATIGVKILSIALVPQGGGAKVTVYTAPTPTPVTNLVMLDQLDEILGNTSIPVGTYTGAVLTVSGNAGDILLTTSSDPEVGFAAAASTTIPSSQIQVQHTQGTGTQSDRAREGEFRHAADGEHDPKQRARSGVRSGASRVSGRVTFPSVRAPRCGRSTSTARYGAGPGTSWRASCCGTPTAT